MDASATQATLAWHLPWSMASFEVGQVHEGAMMRARVEEVVLDRSFEAGKEDRGPGMTTK